MGLPPLPGPLVTASLSVSAGTAFIAATTRRSSAGRSGGSGQGMAKLTVPPRQTLDDKWARTTVVPGVGRNRATKHVLPQGLGLRSTTRPFARVAPAVSFNEPGC